MRSFFLMTVLCLSFLLLSGVNAALHAQERPPLELETIDALGQTLIAAIGGQYDGGLDALWQDLIDAGEIPFIREDRVVFMYRGDAQSVEWRGDFSGWQGDESNYGERILGTDLWLLVRRFPVDARLDYKIMLNGRELILDPVNAREQWGGFGPNSTFAMPDYVPSPWLAEPVEVPASQLSDWQRIDSAELGYSLQYRVYIPADYETRADVPSLYVTDGHEYSDARLGALPQVLDQLGGQGLIDTPLVVFIDPRNPDLLSVNRREAEFLGNRAYNRFIVQELLPLIDSSYRTRTAADERGILGTSYGGVHAAFLGLEHSDLFGLVAMQSPALEAYPEIRPRFSQIDALPLRIWAATGRPSWDSDPRLLIGILELKGYELSFETVNEGHSWGQWRHQLGDMLLFLFV